MRASQSLTQIWVWPSAYPEVLPHPNCGLCDPEQMHSHARDEKDFYLFKELTTISLELYSEFAHVSFLAVVMRLGNLSPKYPQPLSINHVSEESEIMPTPQESLWQKGLCLEKEGKPSGPKTLTEWNQSSATIITSFWDSHCEISLQVQYILSKFQRRTPPCWSIMASFLQTPMAPRVHST